MSRNFLLLISEMQHPIATVLLSYISADKVLNAGVSFKLYLVCLLLSSNNGMTAIMIDFKTKLLK